MFFFFSFLSDSVSKVNLFPFYFYSMDILAPEVAGTSPIKADYCTIMSERPPIRVHPAE
jgi:hypothetical protein